MLTTAERIEDELDSIDTEVADVRRQITILQRRRKALTDERYALVKAREFLNGDDGGA
jgi:hypothetical protein